MVRRCRGAQGRPGFASEGILTEAVKFALLDAVVLRRDLPEHGLRAGDLGAVVERYGEEGVEVEFVQASGRTKAVITLHAADLRAVGDADMLAVRSA